MQSILQGLFASFDREASLAVAVHRL